MTSFPDDRPRSNRAVYLVCLLLVAFAALVTGMAPAYSVNLTRQGDGSVTAISQRYVLFAIPVQSQEVAGVSKVQHAVDHPPPSTPDKPTEQPVTPEPVGTLTLTGNGSPLGVMIDPEQIGGTEPAIWEFLAGSAPSLRLYLVSSWLVSVYVPAGILVPVVLLLGALVWERLAAGFRRTRRR